MQDILNGPPQQRTKNARRPDGVSDGRASGERLLVIWVLGDYTSNCLLVVRHSVLARQSCRSEREAAADS